MPVAAMNKSLFVGFVLLISCVSVNAVALSVDPFKDCVVTNKVAHIDPLTQMADGIDQPCYTAITDYFTRANTEIASAAHLSNLNLTINSQTNFAMNHLLSAKSGYRILVTAYIPTIPANAQATYNLVAAAINGAPNCVVIDKNLALNLVMPQISISLSCNTIADYTNLAFNVPNFYSKVYYTQRQFYLSSGMVYGGTLFPTSLSTPDFTRDALDQVGAPADGHGIRDDHYSMNQNLLQSPKGSFYMFDTGINPNHVEYVDPKINIVMGTGSVCQDHLLPGGVQNNFDFFGHGSTIASAAVGKTNGFLRGGVNPVTLNVYRIVVQNETATPIANWTGVVPANQGVCINGFTDRLAALGDLMKVPATRPVVFFCSQVVQAHWAECQGGGNTFWNYTYTKIHCLTAFENTITAISRSGVIGVFAAGNSFETSCDIPETVRQDIGFQVPFESSFTDNIVIKSSSYSAEPDGTWLISHTSSILGQNCDITGASRGRCVLFVPCGYNMTFPTNASLSNTSMATSDCLSSLSSPLAAAMIFAYMSSLPESELPADTNNWFQFAREAAFANSYLYDIYSGFGITPENWGVGQSYCTPLGLPPYTIVKQDHDLILFNIYHPGDTSQGIAFATFYVNPEHLFLPIPTNHGC